MSNIYLGIALSVFFVLLAYFILSKLLLLVFCVLFAGLYLKNDLFVFRYIEVHVASFYLWICENYRSIQNMYHQSNNTNYTPKYEENNGSISDKFEKLLQHRLKARPTSATTANNLNRSPSCMQSESLASSTPWQSSRNAVASVSFNRSPLMENISMVIQNQYKVSSDLEGKGMYYAQRHVPPKGPKIELLERKDESTRSSTLSPPRESSMSVDWKSPKQSPVDVKLYANVNSPGFCSRVAEEINETMTHQPQYNSIGVFPRINLSNQSQPKKIKIPVRVRLAPPTSGELLYSNMGLLNSSPLSGPDDSMKSVLQVLKEISRKRIHSHVDEDLEEQSKRLRYTENQFMADNATSHTSLLQQTIQGKRAREDSSPTDDIKKRRKPSVNNEISASLSSSIAMNSPHSASSKRKRKARGIDDSIPTPVLGKLLKVQKEIVPPPTAVSTPTPAVQSIKEVSVDQVMIEASSAPPPPPAAPRSSPEEGSPHPASRLLGRFAGHERPPAPAPRPAAERDPFSAVNDLGLSPPKENRLAAMIAVLGGPPDLDVLTSEKKPENMIKGKALFTTPETPETPKQNRKSVTFAEDLTMTKIFEKDSTESKTSTESIAPTLAPQLSVSNTSTESVTPNLSSNSITTNLPGFSMSSPFPTAVAPSTSPSTMFNSGSASTVVEVQQSKPMFGGSTNQREVTSTAKSTSTSTASTPSFNFSSQPSPNIVPSSSPSVSVNSTNATNASTSESKPFSFGPISSAHVESEITPKQATTTAANSMFSFGNAKAAESSGLKPAFGITTTPKEAAKPTPTSEATSIFASAQKPSFDLFNSRSSVTVAPDTKPENKTPIVNGLPETNAASPFATQQKPEATKTSLPAFGTNTSSTPVFSFGSSAQPASSNSAPVMFSAKSEATTTKPTSLANTQPMTMFTNVVSAAAETKPFSFGSQNTSSPASTAASGTNMFGNTTKPSLAPTTQSNTPNLFGNPTSNPTSTTFGSTSGANQASGSPFGIALNNATPVTQPSSLFASAFGGATTSAATGSQSTTFNSGSASTVVEAPQSKPMFGGSTTPAFGTASTNQTLTFGTSSTNLPPAFGTPSSNPQPAFGTTVTNPPSAFGSQNNSTPSPFAFNSPSTQNQNKPAPSFRSQSGLPSFGAQTTTPGFGNQTTAASFGTQSALGTQSATPTFGAQSAAAGFGAQNATLNFGTPNAAPSFGAASSTPSFGNQNSTTGFGSQSGTTFGASGPFNQTNSTTSENKPPAFGASSPFMFGSSTSKEPAKPFASAAPFNFGASSQPAANPTPAFGATNAFGNAQPPAFGASTQPTTGGFNFTASPSAPSFQFNATLPQQPAPGGGMFNIGSGSSGPRSKTGPARRRTRT